MDISQFLQWQRLLEQSITCFTLVPTKSIFMDLTMCEINNLLILLHNMIIWSQVFLIKSPYLQLVGSLFSTTILCLVNKSIFIILNKNKSRNQQFDCAFFFNVNQINHSLAIFIEINTIIEIYTYIKGNFQSYFKIFINFRYKFEYL